MPDWKSVVRERLASLHLEPTVEPDLTEEIAQHLEDRYRELLAGGAGHEAASAQVLAELDDLRPMRAGLNKYARIPARDPVPAGAQRSGSFLEDLARDLRYAVRSMRRGPWFALVVLLTLALGIGANSSVFTLIDTLLLNPLPVANPSRLAAVATADSKTQSRSGAPLPISYLNFEDLRAKNEVFSSLAGYTSPRTVTLRVGRDSERMFAELATSNYFSTLGLDPALGRFFLPEEDTAPGAHAVAVMNYATWRSRFGGAPDIVGKTLQLNNVAFTVIGVAPPRFIGVNAIFGPDLWIPATMCERLYPNEMGDALIARGKAVFFGVGRLKPRFTRSQAQADLATVASALAREYPDANQGHAVSVRPIVDAAFGSAGAGSAPILFASAGLLIVAAIVLLIACSNVANLLLARSAARRHDIALRLALGASRARLVRQLLTESVLLALLGGLAGLWMGYAGLRFLWSFRPAEVSANLATPTLDTAAFAFALVVSLLTGLLFGTLPAWRASRIGVAEILKEEAHLAGRTRSRITLANALLIGQVAFSFLLLVTAALFLRSIARAYEIDPGFQTSRLAVLLTNPGQAGYSKPRTTAFYNEVRERVTAFPGVESVSWASNLPLWGRLAAGLEVEGRTQRSKADTITTVLNTVDLGYFRTAGIAVDKGRAFVSADREDSAPVAIVNEKLAGEFWPREDPLDKHIRLPGEAAMRRIVGVARTANYSSLGERPQLCVYVPLAQNYSDAMTLYVRSKGDPRRLLSPLQRAVRAAGPEVLANDVRTGRILVDQALFTAKMAVALLTVFGLLALALASVGLYGLMTYSVNLRRREIGVRMALGAGQFGVLRLILKQGLSMVATGILIGLAAALLAGRLLGRALYGVSPEDPLSVAGAALILLAVALVACYLPARWASRVDPLVALREG